MHIIVMLLAITPVFFTALFLMCFYRDRLRHHPMIHHLFIGVCAVFFYCWNYAAYELRWLEEGFMTLQNISPFICTIILLTPFMKEKIRDFTYAAIALLSFGMFVALFVSPEVEYVVNFHQSAKLIHVTEAACHCVMGLYGFYLVLSGRVQVCAKTYRRSLIFTYSVIGYGLFLNYFFHRSFFGMNMYGDHSIYFMDLFGSFEVTLLAYLFGVFFTLTAGYLVCMGIDRLSRHRTLAEVRVDTTDHTDEAQAS